MHTATVKDCEDSLARMIAAVEANFPGEIRPERLGTLHLVLLGIENANWNNCDYMEYEAAWQVLADVGCRFVDECRTRRN